MRLLLWLLSPLSYLYQFFFFLDKSRQTSVQLDGAFVISVGNLSFGGTGKTPVVQAIIKLLLKRFPDYQYTILSRGYKAGLSGQGALVSASSLPIEVGDEPLLHKQSLPNVQMIIGGNRVKSYLTFNQMKNGPHIVLLDDGFQHHRIKRNMDIVLLDANAPFGNGFTIPLGTLRERPHALQRATAVLFTKVNSQNRENVIPLQKEIQSKYPHLPNFVSKFEPKLEVVVSSISSSVDSYCLVTGVGNPNSVLKTSNELIQKQPIRMIQFPDHHHYTELDLEKIVNQLAINEALLTTEKDWVKWKFLPSFLSKVKERNIQISLLKIELVVEQFEIWESLFIDHVSNYAKGISPV